ncbi:MAG: hypothetical protein Q9209_007150 [Squamulea sp. 1 TL-2023]
MVSMVGDANSWGEQEVILKGAPQKASRGCGDCTSLASLLSGHPKREDSEMLPICMWKAYFSGLRGYRHCHEPSMCLTGTTQVYYGQLSLRKPISRFEEDTTFLGAIRALIFGCCQAGSRSRCSSIGKRNWSHRSKWSLTLSGRSEEVERETLWRRIFNAFNYGDVLITLGTGKISEFEEHKTGLISEHDYAVVDLQESDTQRRFLVKNPWSRGGGWIAYDGGAQEYNAKDCVEPVSISVTALAKELDGESQHIEPGTFWMSINDVFQQFESLYLNWNLGLFTHREDIHFSWDLVQRNGGWASVGNNPQYQLYSKVGGTVWLLLNRHLKSSNRVSQDGSSIVSASDTGFISVYIYYDKGDRIYLTDGPCTRSPYVDSLNTLLKVELAKNARCTVVISEQELDRSRHNFTLSGFSLQRLSMSEAYDRYYSRTVRNGEWTSATAGGNASSACYFQNPQFSIHLPQLSDVSLLLELAAGEIPIHVRLMRTDGKPVRFVMSRDIVGDSGEYRKGHAYAEIRNVPAGRYTIICSTFEQGQLGRFTLHVGTMLDCTVERLSSRPAGRFVSQLPTAVFGPQIDRLWAMMRCSRLTRLSVVARSHGTANMPNDWHKPSDLPLKVSLELGQGPMKRVLAVSGNDDFCNGYYGAQLDDVDIQPYMCAQAGIWIVIERAGPLELHSQAVTIEVYSDSAIEVGSFYQSS